MQENEIQIRVKQEIEKILSDPRQMVKIYQKALQESDAEIQSLKNTINTDLVPKVDMYERVMGTDKLCDMKQVAKILNFKGMGRNNLFDYLKKKQILSEYKEPYQIYVNAGYFKIVEESFVNNGYEGTYLKTVVTQKGIDYIGKLLKDDNYEPTPK